VADYVMQLLFVCICSTSDGMNTEQSRMTKLNQTYLISQLYRPQNKLVYKVIILFDMSF